MTEQKKEPGQVAYEAYYRAIGGWAGARDFRSVSPDERECWSDVEQAITYAVTLRLDEAVANAERRAREEAWIPVTERLPEYGSIVLVPGGAGYFDGKHWQSVICNVREIQWEVTHWQPMPSPPLASGAHRGGER